MSEHQPSTSDPEKPSPRSEGEPDFRRLEVAYRRFAQLIGDGIAMGLAEQTEIDDTTARCIAHVLGRAYGRQSALAGFGRTGEGHYLTLRDEYLNLYTDQQADTITNELIDWLGTYLVQRENTGTGRRFMNEHLPPKLSQLLVRTRLRVADQHIVANVPASWDSGDIDGLIETLGELKVTEDDALRAFLELPDVSAGTENIMESFHEAFAGTYPSEEDALRALSPLEDWETSLADWCIDNGIEHEALEWNYEPLMNRLRDLYDLVESEGRIHAFIR